MDYTYYLNEYLAGKSPLIPAENFPLYVRSAGKRLERYIGEVPDTDDAKLCQCELTELIYSDAQTGRAITSEHTGDLSVTYESSEARAKSLASAVRECVYRWFADSGLLYRGV